MRKTIAFLSILLLFNNVTKAQYVNLPDTNFRNFLQYAYPTCFNTAGQLDTTCNEIVTEDSLSLDNFFLISNTANLQGLRYFKQLKTLQLFIIPNGVSLPELPPALKALYCSNVNFLSVPPVLPASIQYIYASNSNFTTGYLFPGGFTQLPSSLLYLDCTGFAIDSLPDLPSSLLYLNCQNAQLRKLPVLPNSLKYLNCSHGWSLTKLPALPLSLTYLNCSNNYYLDSLPALPALLDTLICSSNQILELPALPNTLTYLDCGGNMLTNFPTLPNNLINLNCANNRIQNTLPPLPLSIKTLSCQINSLTSLPLLPSSLIELNCSHNKLTALPAIPSTLINLYCGTNRIAGLPVLPNSLKQLSCGDNPIYSIASFPDSLVLLECYWDSLSSLPSLPPRLLTLYCDGNQLTGLPALPARLRELYCANNQLNSLPDFPNTLSTLKCFGNNIYCLPKLPLLDQIGNDGFPITLYFSLAIDSGKIKCLPNHPRPGIFFELHGFDGNIFPSINQLPLCNPTNNTYHCEAFPFMQGTTFYDYNNNGIKDVNETVKKNVQINLSNESSTFTNNTGLYEIGADSIGNYSLTATAPRYYTYVPSSYNFNFASYDTMVTNNFALQATTTIDELTVRVTPVNWAARPGFSFPYMITYENTGTTTLSPTIVFDYDQARLDYNTSSIAGVTDNASMLTFNNNILAPGQSGSFIGYFTLKTTVPLGDTLNAKATISANAFIGYDSVQTNVRGAFDPNDKQATPQLSPSQVANGKYIDYTIRFQNTGTDTAFNIVISDTLNENLQAESLQMLVSSHNCKATVKDNIVFFEFLNILLPDSNVNEPKSHGFVSFRIKPQTIVLPNTIIPNKAAIYFDYNVPVMTNIASTVIKDFTVVPLKLISFSAVPQNDNTVSLNWNTANEINTKYFTIEKSTDALRFNSVTNVAAKGKATNDYYASVRDENSGITFYRLKIVDNDGRFSYSPIIKIDRRKDAAGFSILTNPVKDFIIINTTDKILNNTQGSLVNTNGAVVKNFSIKQGSQTVEIKGMPAGIYYLKTFNGSSKIIIL